MPRWFRSRELPGLTILHSAGICAIFITAFLSSHPRTTAQPAASSVLLPISIDYPEPGSIFPPGITPPTFLWRDAAGTSWSLDVSFADGTPPIRVAAGREHMHLGEIDPETVSESNRPELTPEQAATWTWKPDPDIWSLIQTHSVAEPATCA